ncbi:MAG TPA: ABC transporter ATP-binding protein [Steroidobacteraceae bacterium]|nr:ABC transporter ATP-binding protein [Steroidobacteraceae bacterium]
MRPTVEVSGLTVVVRGADGLERPIVRDVGFVIEKGEVLALIGESGSGKTTIALALLGYARPGSRIAAGSLRVAELDLRALGPAQLAALRGRRVAYVAQSAAAAFNPAHTILDQVIEPVLIHGLADRPTAEAKAIALFRSLSLPDPEHIGRRYPHEISGGQLQRAMAAMALITDPELVVFDEPTTALDVTTQIEVLRAFKQAVRERATTAVYVSHDLAVVAQMADRIVVLQRGEIREHGSTAQVLEAPADAYTKTLLAAARPAPREAPASTASPMPRPLLTVRGLTAGYGGLGADDLPRHPVLVDIDLEVVRGTTLGIIGESGSGKSTLARAIAGLVPMARGRIELDGVPLASGLAGRTREQFRRVQIVFQDADTSLNPAHTVERILARPLELYHAVRGAEARARIARLLDLVRLPAEIASRLPRELSGGQKQRVNLARALAAEPDLILCDEVTSALDTVVGAAILELLAELRREVGVSYVFISHDISTVRAICDEIVVLYAGRKVESGSRRTLADPPFHPYTERLIASVPELRQGWLEEVGAPRGPSTNGRPVGREAARLCCFLARCPVRIEGLCDANPPPARGLKDKQILCHHSPADLARLQTPVPSR